MVKLCCPTCKEPFDEADIDHYSYEDTDIVNMWVELRTYEIKCPVCGIYLKLTERYEKTKMYLEDDLCEMEFPVPPEE